MRLNITRKELYDLVWSKPRSDLAMQLRISDVRLGKLCRELNVPAPPRGYWANLSGARRRRKFLKPPLTYNVAERIEEDHDAFRASLTEFDPERLEQPIPPPPVVPSDFDETVKRYRSLIDKTAVRHADCGLHLITQKFVNEDERLAQLAKKSSWYKPKFTSSEGTELLEGLNRLLWFFVDLGLVPRASGYRDIVMRVGHGRYWRTFEVAIADPTSRDTMRSRATLGRFQLWFDTQQWERRSTKPALTFPDFTRNVLRSISLLVVERWEKDFRESVQRKYDWQVSERKRAIELVELERERERQRRAAEMKATLESRNRLLADALERLAKARDIRLLVEALDRRVRGQPNAAPDFDRWRSWALLQADRIDPTTESFTQLNDWFGKFHLERHWGDQ